MAFPKEENLFMNHKAYIPEIKICGITTVHEVEMINEAKVEYAGFVFCETSKRNVSLKTVEQLIRNLNQDMIKVAVFLDPDYEIIGSLRNIGIDGVQIHKSFQKENIDEELFLWDVCSIEHSMNEELFHRCQQKFRDPRISGVLFDAKSAGGGKQFSWDISDDINRLRAYGEDKKMILAGGLNPDNVSLGIKQFHPDVVDVSSGVEGIDGKKSKDKITQFVRKVRNHE